MAKEAPPTKASSEFTEEEIARRRDETTRRMIATPRKPNADLPQKKKKKGKAKA